MLNAGHGKPTLNVPDPKVAPQAKRRTFPAEYKQSAVIVGEENTCHFFELVCSIDIQRRFVPVQWFSLELVKWTGYCACAKKSRITFDTRCGIFGLNHSFLSESFSAASAGFALATTCWCGMTICFLIILSNFLRSGGKSTIGVTKVLMSVVLNSDCGNVL